MLLRALIAALLVVTGLLIFDKQLKITNRAELVAVRVTSFAGDDYSREKEYSDGMELGPGESVVFRVRIRLTNGFAGPATGGPTDLAPRQR